jgi:hypothetical protein
MPGIPPFPQNLQHSRLRVRRGFSFLLFPLRRSAAKHRPPVFFGLVEKLLAGVKVEVAKGGGYLMVGPTQIV